MPIADVDQEHPPHLAPGSAAVCVPLYGGHDHFARCLESLVAHTPAATAILIADDATPDRASRAFAEATVGARLLYWYRAPENRGFVENVNAALRLVNPADAVIVNSDVIVADGWFDRLRGAAYSRTDAATATPLTNHGTIVSIPDRNHPSPGLPEGLDVDQVAARVARSSRQRFPTLPTAIGHCMYLRRDALEHIGLLDPTFSPGYGEEVDYSQRCLAAGWVHVLADDVFVLHHGGGSFGDRDDRPLLQREHEELIATRYPDYHAAVREAAGATDSPLADALATASAALLDRGDQQSSNGWLSALRRRARRS